MYENATLKSQLQASPSSQSLLEVPGASRVRFPVLGTLCKPYEFSIRKLIISVLWRPRRLRGPISCFGHPPQTLSILYQKHMISVLWRPGRLLGQISCFGHPPTTLSNPYYLVAPIHSANGHRKVSRCGDLPHRCSWWPPPQKELANSPK